MGIDRDSVKWERGGRAAEGAMMQGSLLPDLDYPHVDTSGPVATANEKLTSSPQFQSWFEGSKAGSDLLLAELTSQRTGRIWPSVKGSLNPRRRSGSASLTSPEGL